MQAWILGVLVLLTVTACKQKKIEAKGCDRAITAVPQEFVGTAASVGGAVKTSSCSTLAVGTNSEGQPLIARYGIDNKADGTFAQTAQNLPFLALFPGYKFAIFRLAVLPEGFLVLGSYASPQGAAEFFAFKITESGLIDMTFGPRGNGVVRADLIDGLTVKDVSAPSMVGTDLFMQAQYVSVTGRNYARTVRIAISGSDPLAAAAPPFAVAPACSNVSLTTFKDGVNYQISQNGCSNMVWTARGNGVNEAFNIVADGSVYSNAFFGQFAMHVEDLTPVVVSHDTLGHLQSEYLSLVTGQSTLCGEAVDQARTYLVLSTQAPAQDDGSSCRFL